jgi:DNA-binding SARP family transcriptional activator
VHRERLAELLWPDRAADAAANNLNQALYAARRALDAAGGDGAAALTLIDGAVVLNAQVDVDAFEAAAARARKDRDPAVYEWALSLHGGDLLPEDRYEPWADARRAALTELHTALCLELAELHGDAPAAVVALQRALVADPLAEPAHCALMRLYSRVIGQWHGLLPSVRGTEEPAQNRATPWPRPTRDNRRCIEACSSVPGPGAFPRRRATYGRRRP